MMKSILIAWELGGGLGHVMRAAAYARELTRQGAVVTLALSDLTQCQLARWPNKVAIIQAPLAKRTLTAINDQANYAEILYSCGYHDAQQVAALVGAWRRLIDQVQPDAVMADHAPTAQLAARLCRLPSVRVGTGFFAPPPVAPAPRFRSWQSVDLKRMLATDARMLQLLNSILAGGGLAPAGSIGAALAPDLDLLASWPELDCYAEARPPGSVIYIGNEHTGGFGAAPAWPQSGTVGSKRIAAYLKGHFGPIEAVLDCLRDSYETVAYVTDLSDAMRRRYVSRNLWFAPEPMDLSAAASSCDAVVCHGGAGTAPYFLEAGKPVLILPYQAEQRVNAERIAATGAGVCLEEAAVKNAFNDKLALLLADPGYAAAAARLAARWAGNPNAVAVGASRVLQLLQGRSEAAPAGVPFAEPTARPIPSMQVEVTTRCNFDCFYCAGRDMPQKDMDYDMFCGIFDRHVACYGIPPVVSLQGEGEPTINRDFFRMAAKVKEAGSRPYTITNGTYKEWEMFLPLFESVGVSMDTLDEQETEKIGRYNLPRVQEFIEMLAAHMPVIVHTVMLGPGAAAVGAWCRERGIRQIVQALQNKSDYQYRYPQFIPRKPREERFACDYLSHDRLRYYDLNGTELPCAFIKDTGRYPGLAEMKRLHEAGRRPPCCIGCLMNKA